MTSLAGDPQVRVEFRMSHMSDNQAWLALDGLVIEDRPVPEIRNLPTDIWMPDAHVEYETGGWGVVEEPLHTQFKEYCIRDIAQ